MRVTDSSGGRTRRGTAATSKRSPIQDARRSDRSQAIGDAWLPASQDLLDAIPSPIFYKDLNGRYLGCNRAFEQLFGRKREELIGKSVFEASPGEIAEVYDEKDRELFDNPGHQTYDWKLVTATGEERDVVFDKATFDDGDGNTAGLIGVILDISEQRAVERRLRLSQSQLRVRHKIAETFLTNSGYDFHDRLLTIIQDELSSPLGVFGFVDEGGLTVCPSCGRQERSEQQRGSERSVFLPRTGLDQTFWGRVLDNNRPTVINDPIQLCSEHAKIRRCLAAPVVFRDQVIGFLAVGDRAEEYRETDIAIMISAAEALAPILHSQIEARSREREQRAAEEALRESKAKYRLLFENMSEAVIICKLTHDHDGSPINCRILGANSAFLSLAGMSREECIGAEFTEKFGDDKAFDLSRYSAVVEEGQSHCYETYSRALDKHLQVSLSSPVKGRIAAILADISGRKVVEAALQESEQRYHEVFNSVMEGIGVVDESEKFRLCNPALAWILEEESVDDVIGKNLLDYVPDKSRGFLKAETERRKKGRSAKYELELISAKGNPKTIFASISPRFDEKGDYLGALGAIIDITDRKLSEERLRNSEQKYRQLVDNVNIGIAMISPSMEVLSINRRMTDWFPSIDLDKHQSCFACFNNPSRTEPCTYCPVVETLKDGKVHESLTQTPAGNEGHDYRIVSSPIFDKEGRVTAAIEMVEDVTEMREAEQRIRELSHVVEQSPSAVVLMDRYERVEYVNNKFTEMTGFLPEDVVGNEICLIDSQKDDQLLQGHACAAVRDGMEWRGEVQARRKNGEQFWQRVSTSPVRDTHGEITHFVAILEDITEQRGAEEKRRELERKLLHASKLEAVGSLAAGIAHEINTPIQFVGDNTHYLSDAFEALLKLLHSYQQMLNQEPADRRLAELLQEAETESDLEYIVEEVPKAIAQTLDGVKRVAGIVRSMKEFAHQDQKERTVSDINKMLESTLTVARNELKYVANVVTEYDPELPPIVCHRNEVNQVFLNLLINAAHSIADVVGNDPDEKGTITVRTKLEGDAVAISISDTGTGIPEKVRNRIFDPFFTTKDVGRGSGQGLAIAHSVVDKHKGSISCETEVGEGTTFTIRLPVGAEREDEQE